MISTEITLSKFYKNKGEKEGGAVSWLGKNPFIDDQILFKDNFAPYGSNISSFPVKLGVDIFEKNGSKIYSSQINSTIAKLRNVSPGKSLPYRILVHILDHYDQIVTSSFG